MISSSEVPLIEEEWSTWYWNPELIVSSDIKCLDKTPWSTFEVSWITYLVVSDRDDLINNIPNITSSYNLCTSHVTDMWYLFSSLTWFNNNFNKDISSWDTSRVTSMAWLFYDSDWFSSDVSSWDTSSVLDMFSMFAYSDNNSADISSWDVSSVSTMDQMFYSSDFNQDISSWCVSLISSIPPNFDTLSWFEWNSSIQPQWWTCPNN